MHKHFLIFLVPLLSFALTLEARGQKGQGAGADCDFKAGKERCMEEIGDFTYSSSRIDRMKAQKEPVRKNVVIPLFYDQPYRLILDRTDAPPGTNVTIFDKSPEEFGRRELFTTEEASSEKKVFVYEPPEDASRVNVQYNTAGGGEGEKGCVVLVVSYGLDMGR